MSQTLTDLEALRDEWQSLQPLKPEDEARLWQKFRLEWNYHSNHIEGNTLTYGETELFFLHDRIQAGHTHREYVEMKAHDAAIEHVRDLASDDRNLREGDIRDLNKIALKEPFWKDAITSDGQPTKKQIVPGEYKTTPNNVVTATGEIFFFARPEDTAPKMQDFVAWLNRELADHLHHPVEIAARCHHDFVLIHPFDDGNGRVARLLVNYILLKTGYPPLIVRSEKKASYLSALQQADAGNLDPLVEHLATELRWSLETAIKAGRGTGIEDVSDVEKELALFVRQQKLGKRDVIRLSPQIAAELYELSWRNLFERFENKMSQVSPLFATTVWTAQSSLPKKAVEWSAHLQELLKLVKPGNRFARIVTFGGYNGPAVAPFVESVELRMVFEEFAYDVVRVFKGRRGNVVKKLYSEPILSDEADEIASQLLKLIFEDIKTQAGK